MIERRARYLHGCLWMKVHLASTIRWLRMTLLCGAVTVLGYPIFSVAQTSSRCEQLFNTTAESANLTPRELRAVRLKALTNESIAKLLIEHESEAVAFFGEFDNPSLGYDVELFKEKGGVYFGHPSHDRVLLVAFKDRKIHPEDALEQTFESILGVSTHQRYAIEIYIGERFTQTDMYLEFQSGWGGEQKVVDYAAKSLKDDLETLRHEFQSPDMIDGFQAGPVRAEGWNHSGPKGSEPLYVFAKLTIVFNSPIKPGREALETLIDFAENHLVPKKR